MEKFYTIVKRDDGLYAASVTGKDESNVVSLARAIIEGDFEKFEESVELKLDLPADNTVTVYDMFAKLLDEILTKENRIQELCHEKNQLNSQLEEVTNEVNEVKARADQAATESSTRIDELTKTVNEVNSALAARDKENAKLVDEIAKLNQVANDQSVQLAEMQGKLALFEESDEAHAKLVRAYLSIDRKLSLLTNETTELKHGSEANKFIDYLNVGLNCLGLLKK